MDTITTTPVLTNREISITDILLACITHRLKKYAVKIPIKDVIGCFLKEAKNLQEIERKSMSYVKALCPSGRVYARCDAKYKDGRKFIQYLEQHPIYRLSQSHNNNVTWYQIAQIVQFIVDLVEECYEAGRTELVSVLIDWCVSFINQQSCIYTSDGWADILAYLPQVCDSHYKTVPIYPLGTSSEVSLTEKRQSTLNRTKLISVKCSNASSKPAYSPVGLPLVKGGEPELDRGGLLKTSLQDRNLEKESIKRATFSKKSSKDKTVTSTARAGPAETFKDKDPTSHKETLKGLLSSKTSSDKPDGVSLDTRSLHEKKEPEYNQVDLSDENFQNVNLKRRSTKKTSFTEAAVIERASSSNTLATTVETSNDRELSLLTCSCGNKNKTKSGNFLGVCDRIECQKSTCLLCCASVTIKCRNRHMARHRIHPNSVITKEHVDRNTELDTATCVQCKKRGCIRDSLRSHNLASCKLCDRYFCTYSGCGKLGKYSEVFRHTQTKHQTKTIAFKSFTSSSPETSGRSKELQLLRCGCKNIDKIERQGKFWGKCGILSCEYYQHYICLICGRTTKYDKIYLKLHLGLHETVCNGPVNKMHVEANLKLYNKVCGKCGQQGSSRYNMVNRHDISRCRCCNIYLCMFPGCEVFFLNGKSAMRHYNRAHVNKKTVE